MLKDMLPKKELFDAEVERVLTEIGTLQPDTEEYRKSVESLRVLCEARGAKSPRTLSTDTLVSAITNIAGILLVLNYEKLGVVTSKAFGMIFRGGKS